MTHYYTAAGLLAVALITLCTVPQVVTVFKERNVKGVSVTAASAACVSCLAWSYYAISVNMVLPAVSSIFGSLLWGLIAVVVAIRLKTAPDLWVFLWLGSLLTVVLTGLIVVLASMLLAEALTNTVPQAIKAKNSSRCITWNILYDVYRSVLMGCICNRCS